MKNYIVINGKKAELTEEQLKALGIETGKKSPFSRVEEGRHYYRIDTKGDVCIEEDLESHMDNRLHNVANYCTDKELLQQQAYREILNRLLWRYSMEHDGDKVNWGCDTKYCIVYDHYIKGYKPIGYFDWQLLGCVYFHTRETAESAIEEIIEPFMKEHPDFKW
jgi:hypothetical protein